MGLVVLLLTSRGRQPFLLSAFSSEYLSVVRTQLTSVELKGLGPSAPVNAPLLVPCVLVCAVPMDMCPPWTCCLLMWSSVQPHGFFIQTK